MKGTRDNDDREDHRQDISWRGFADGLTHLAAAEGSAQFLDQAFRFLGARVPVDSCSVFKVSGDRRSGAEHLATFGRLAPALADQLADDYVLQGFRADPMVQTALMSDAVRVRHLPGSRYGADYRERFFAPAGLSDKVSSIHTSKDVLFLVNFYRLQTSGAFTTAQFRDLQRLGPILGRFVLRHIRLRGGASDTLESRIDALLSDVMNSFSILSPREREVVRRILLGETENTIAEALGVEPSTVVTHRRRSYAKLGLASQGDLFRLAMTESL